MYFLFSSTVCFIGLPWDSTRTIKGLLPSWNTSTILKFCNSHPSLPLEALLLSLINTCSPLSFAFGLSLAATFQALILMQTFSNLIVFQHVPAESAHSADKIKFLEPNICLHHSIRLHDAGHRFQVVVP